MPRKSITLLFLILIGASCSEPKDPKTKQTQNNQPYTLTASLGKYVEDNSGRKLLVNVVLTNNTTDTLSFWEWTCFQNDEYTVKSEALESNKITVCDANFPIEKQIPPHKSKESIETLFFKKGFGGGSINYQMTIDLYIDPGNNKIILPDFQNKITPKPVQSNVVEMYIDSGIF